ncbi:MAG: hypothetical protein ACOX8E_08080 [Ruminococcus sp.]
MDFVLEMEKRVMRDMQNSMESAACEKNGYFQKGHWTEKKVKMKNRSTEEKRM